MPVAEVCVAVHTGWAFRPKRGDGHWGSRWARGKACRASTGPQKHGAERRPGRCAWRFAGDTQEFEFQQGEFRISTGWRVSKFGHFNLISTFGHFFSSTGLSHSCREATKQQQQKFCPNEPGGRARLFFWSCIMGNFEVWYLEILYKPTLRTNKP